MVTVSDVVTVLQRTEMVRRIAEEVDGYSIELGTDGRLVRLQLEEMLAGVEDERRQVLRDYLPGRPGWRWMTPQRPEPAHDRAAARPDTRSPACSASGARAPTWKAACGLTATGCCRRSPRLPDSCVRNIVSRYGGLAGDPPGQRRRPRQGRGHRSRRRPFREGRASPAWPRRASSTGSADRLG